ncbi:MAG: 50S ribosomal protein L29 [Elusimicrobiales bacterium]|nr:50S ribosomal protein L29 [Elusimicrobiales bacterium]
MKKREKESIRNMNEAELNAMLRDLEKELFELKFNKKISPLDNPLRIRNLRRKIAFVKTIINEKKIKSFNIKE